MSPTKISLPILLVYILLSKISSESDESEEDEIKCREPYEEDLEKFINYDIDPCEDFYTFMCSKWKIKHPIPMYYDDVWNYNYQKKYISGYKVLVYRYVRAIRSILNGAKYHQKLRNYYDSCMEYGMTNDTDIPVKELRKILDIIGGFPALGIPLKDDYNWEDAVALLTRELDFSEVLLKLDVQKNLKHYEKNVITLDAGSLGVEREKLLFCNTHGATGCNDYKKKIRNFLIDLNNGNSFHEFDVIVDNIVAFEKILAQITSASEDDSVSYEVMSLKDLPKILNYKANITRVLQTVFHDIISIDDDTEVAVIHSTYIKSLARLLAKTNNDTIAHYIGWRVIQEFSDAANLFYPNDPRNPKNVVSFAQRQRHCTKSTERHFALAMAHNYFQLHGYIWTPTSEIKKMFKVLREVYSNLISNSDWMDNVTEIDAHNKLDKMWFTSYGPPRIKQERLIDDYYFMEIPKGDYFKTYLDMRREDACEKFGLITKRPDYTSPWLKYLTQFVTTYDRTRNLIYLPAGAITSFLFRSDSPTWMQFAHIGTNMAREIFHAFDKIGSRYTNDGTLENWWSPETEKRYNKKVRCFLEQYGRYKDPMQKIPLNAIKTLEENIADNVGLQVSFMAYKKYRSEGLAKCYKYASFYSNFTAYQLFFITYGWTLCGYHKKEDGFKYYRESRYSPAIHRIIGTLSNSIEFRKAFKCEPSSEMYTDKVCSIW